VIALVDTLVQGVLLGGLYALFAMGQSLVFGVMRLTNTAQGDFIVLAAFAVLSLSAATGLSAPAAPAVALIVVVPAAFAAGYGLQRFVLNGTLGADPLPSLVVTFGLSIVIQNLLQEIFTANPRSIPSGGLDAASLKLAGGVSVGVLPLLILGVAVLMAVVMQATFDRTPIGRAFRAVSDDRDAADLMGLDHRHIYGLATGTAFVLIAVAGALQGLKTTVSPADGPALLLYSFEAVGIGGLGSFYGTLAGGVVLGVTQAIGFRLNPGWGIWLGHVVFLVMMIVRPRGLFPRTRGAGVA
jgi:branched-chain amino acid transport system permease protein